MKVELKLDKRFAKKAKGMFGKYDFEVGILRNAPHREAQSKNEGLSSYAGGPIRKATRSSNQSIAAVSEANRKRMGVNYLTAPFKKRSSDIIKFSNEFFKLVFGRSEKRRAENLLQAVVRNPILRGDYGDNSEKTKKIKGFNRYLIDTAQIFKAIRARTKVNRV